MEPVPPFWFLQRQGKVERAGSEVLKLSAPNLRDAFIAIGSSGQGTWYAALRQSADGPDLAVTPAEFSKPEDAWQAAFELYRTHFVI
jgi:hypothetical protein